MTRKIIYPHTSASEVKEAPKPEPFGRVEDDDKDANLSLDEVGKIILMSLDKAAKQIYSKIKHGDVSRETIGSLKDCEAIYRELSKKEKEFIENASDEDLEKLLKK